MLLIDEMGHAEGFGEAWFYEKAITKILSCADSYDRHHTNCSDWIQDDF